MGGGRGGNVRRGGGLFRYALSDMLDVCVCVLEKHT